MAIEYNPYEDWILQGEPETTPIIVASGEGIVPPRTPLVFDPASGHYKKATAADKATRMSVYEIEAVVSEKEVQAYKVGQFNISLVNWPAEVDTYAKKQTMFHGSGITVGAPYKV